MNPPREPAVIGPFGHYVVLGELGAGAMGVVYQARHVALNRSVALKVLRRAVQPRQEEEHRFRVEAEAAASLDHPNIVPIYEVGEHEGQLFLSMKLLPGGSLAEAVAGQPLPPRRAAGLLATLARAVAHAHRCGVIHRDLKPGNILLDDQGEPHLTDFGLAKLRDAPQQLTATQATLGTPAFMAPEVVRDGARAATIASDVYSLGAVLYQALTGRPPFTGETPMAVLAQVMNTDPPPPSRVAPAVPHDLEVICLKALRHEPAQRYASAAEFAEDLQRYLDGTPIAARRPGLAEVGAHWVCRHRVAAGFGAALLVSLTIGLGATWWEWRRAGEFRQDSHTARTQLTETRAARFQREAEAMFASHREEEALRSLAQLVHANPSNQLCAARLFAALSQRYFLWPVSPPLAHQGEVRQGIFTPDGRRVLTAAEDGMLRVWETASGAPLVQVPHDAARGRFDLSPDGQKVATLSTQGVAQVWELLSGRPLWSSAALTGAVTSVAFSPDGVLLATLDTTGLACLWRVQDGLRCARFEHGPAGRRLLWSTDGERLFTLGEVGKIWRRPAEPGAETGQEVGRTPLAVFEPVAPVRHAEASPAGDLILTVASNRVQLWSSQTGAATREFPFAQEVNHASFGPNGDGLAVGNADQRAYQYNAHSGGRRTAPLVHPRAVTAVRFDPARRWLVTACLDGQARLWGNRGTVSVAETFGQKGPLREAVFSPDGKHLLTLSADGTARLWATPRPLADEWPVTLAEGEARFDLSPDARWLAVAHPDHVLSLSPATFAETGRLSVQHSNTIQALAFSGDGRWLASGDASGLVVLSAVPPVPTNVHRFLWQDQPVARLHWSPDSRRLAVVSSNGIHLRNVAAAEPAAAVRVATARVRSLDFSPDGARLLVAGEEPQAGVFDCLTGQLCLKGPLHPGSLLCVRFSPDGRRAACSSQGNAVSVWEVSTGQLSCPMMHPGADAACLAFSPDSRTLLTGGVDGAVHLWELAHGTLLLDMLRHGRAVSSAEFSPNGVWVVTSGEDEMVRLTHAASGLPGGERPDLVVRPSARFSRDGARVLVFSEAAPPRVLKVPAAFMPAPDTLVRMTELLLGQRLNNHDGWEELPPEGYRERLHLVRATFSSPGPPPLARFFRIRRPQP